ncbi:MAG: hypothetical protein E7159_06095 [Firmicutes bacterium]|nr:hypothetical protein [Bacillota bacterium]
MFYEFLQMFLPIIIYLLLIAVLIIAIIIGIKCVTLLNNVNHLTESISDKVDSLNGLFRAIDFATDKVSEVTTKIVDTIVSGVSKVVHRKSKKEKEEEEDL